MQIFQSPAPQGEASTSSLRLRWLGQHERFLSRAFSTSRVPLRIPRLRADRGGFAPMMRNPDTRRMIDQWWTRVLEATTLDD